MLCSYHSQFLSVPYNVPTNSVFSVPVPSVPSVHIIPSVSCVLTLIFFWSGTHGLNEELGRHRGREGNKECVLCGNECESVSHVLWECSAYRADFLLNYRRS